MTAPPPYLKVWIRHFLQKVKNWKIIEISGPKSGQRRWSFTRDSMHLRVFDWKSFGVLDRRMRIGGGPLRKVVTHGGSTV